MTDIEELKRRATLYRKIAAVTAAVSRIPKNGENTFHRYKYATESDITDGLRALLAENGLAFLPPSVIEWQRDETIDNPKVGARTRVHVQFAIGCTDTGELFTSSLWGEGADTGDKGFYKAYTGAVKYFLMKTFLIATGDDPDDDSKAPQQAVYQKPEPRQQAAPNRTNGDSAPAPTLNDAMRKTYERASAHAGRVIENWSQLMTWVNRPVTTPQPTTIDGWRALYRLCDERATELAAEQEGIPA